MKLIFKTLAGEEVRVVSNTIHLVKDTNKYDEDDPNPHHSSFKVIVGEEYFIYPISGNEYCRLCREFDQQEK